MGQNMEKFVCYGNQATQVGCLSLLAGKIRTLLWLKTELKKYTQKFKLSLSLGDQKDKISMNGCLKRPRDF